MVVLQVFDPPMCCASGVCGPSFNPALPRFAADLEWLKSHGVVVERFNLAQEPAAFAENSVAQRVLADAGPKCLPLILVDGQVVSWGVYPSRDEMTAFAGIAAQEPAARGRAPSLVHLTTRGGGCCKGDGCCG